LTTSRKERGKIKGFGLGDMKLTILKVSDDDRRGGRGEVNAKNVFVHTAVRIPPPIELVRQSHSSLPYSFSHVSDMMKRGGRR
jgi:hypothetical protein